MLPAAVHDALQQHVTLDMVENSSSGELPEPPA
jgi:hypothetical protein